MPSGAAASWVPVSGESDFPIENLPYGVFAAADGCAHIGAAIGESIFDLHAAGARGHFDGAVPAQLLREPTLNALLAAGPTVWAALRTRLAALLGPDSPVPPGDRAALVVARGDARMCLPVHVGDYVDFYSSIEHATNLGKIFRPNGEALMPNWRWIPIGYHGRSSTIVVDGTPVTRPCGQRKPSPDEPPVFEPSRMLDVELEVGFITGSGNLMGRGIPVQRAREHIFGMVLVNDWSARDIQAWEYQPLGPFLGKSFATSISPWVVTLEALEPYRVAGPTQDPAPLPYLRDAEPRNYDVALQVALQTARMREGEVDGEVVSRTNFRHMYWSIAQQLAHASANGTAIRPGDLYASGTISGSEPQSYGSFIELTWRGQRPLHLASGETRTFLEDGDTVEMRGFCAQPGKPRIGFGRVSGTILPARRDETEWS